MVRKKSHISKKRERRTSKFHLNEEDAKTEKILIENFVALQRVITHLSEKFDYLATQISKMLNLFEISAKSLAEKEFNKNEDTRDVRKVVEKLDGLIEQNKTIAKGLLLLHDEVSPTKSSMQRPEAPLFPVRAAHPSKPIPNPPQERRVPKQILTLPQEKYFSPQTQNVSQEKYQKSISSEGEDDFSSKPQLPRFTSALKEENG